MANYSEKRLAVFNKGRWKTKGMNIAVAGFSLLLTLLSCIQHRDKPESLTGFKRVVAKQHGEIVGIDVSHHNGTIDWKTVKKSRTDLAFVYVKCTEGKDYIDPQFKSNVKGAASQGYKVGAYHYFRMTSSAHDQFKSFKSQMDAVPVSLIPMVDVERNDGKPRKELQDSLQVLLDLLEDAYGKKPMIYGTNRSYNEFCAPEFNHYPLYIGRYGKNRPVVTGPSHYAIWQYTESGKILGIPKDVDICRVHPDYREDYIKKVLCL